MAFNRITIKDRVVTGGQRYTFRTLGDGRVEIVPTPDNVTEEGTKVDAELLQRYEEGIYDNLLEINTKLASAEVSVNAENNKVVRRDNTGRINIAAGINNGHAINKGQLDGEISTLNDSINDKVTKNNNIVAGTNTKITYDAKGLVTSGANLAALDIPNLATSKITSGTFADARIPSLNASKINAGAFDPDRIPALPIAKISSLQNSLNDKVTKNANITAGTFPKITYDSKGLVTGGGDLIASDIPNLATSKITSGTFADARIPSLNASKITGGIFQSDRIPALPISKVTDLQTTLDAKLNQNATPITAGTNTKITYDAKGLVTGGTILAAGDIPNLNTSKITDGTFVDARIPNLSADKITTDTFHVNRIPSLAISKITNLQNSLNDKVTKNANIVAGTFPKITFDAKGLVTGGGALVAGDIPNLNASKINAGAFEVARIPNLAPTKITQNATNRFVTDVEKTYWNGKQDKLVAGENITIDGNNVISASGGGGSGGLEYITFSNTSEFNSRVENGFVYIVYSATLKAFDLKTYSPFDQTSDIKRVNSTSTFKKNGERSYYINGAPVSLANGTFSVEDVSSTIKLYKIG